MKADTYVEIYLLNKNVASLPRVLQQMQALGVWTRQEMTAHEMRLEELQATLNLDAAEHIVANERADQQRFESQRLATELHNRLRIKPLRK